MTAYHEAGHAVLIRNLENSDPVHQVTIIPRGMAGGMTMFLPKEDRTFDSKKHMESSLVHLLGGRVAEALVLDDISTGASNDIERATDIARNMVTRYGMSEKLGTVNYSHPDEVFIGKDFASKQTYSDETAALIDCEIKRLIDEAYAKAEKLLKENMDKLELIAETLLDIETLDAEQFEQLYTGEKSREEIIEEARRTIKEREERIAKQKAREAKEEAEARAKFEADVIRQAEKMNLNGKNSKNIIFENKNSQDGDNPDADANKENHDKDSDAK